MKPYQSILNYVLILLTASLLFACSSKSAPTEDPLNLPKAANANVQLGLNYLKKKDVMTAKERLLMAEAEAPNNPTVQDALGYFFEVTGDQSNAENYYTKAIKSSSGSGPTYNNYGTFLCRQGQYDKAIQQFQLAASDPQYINTAGAYENAGICALSGKNFVAAEDFFTKALNATPHSLLSLAGISDAYYSQGELEKAKLYLANLESIAPTDPITIKLAKKINRRIRQQKIAMRAKKQEQEIIVE